MKSNDYKTVAQYTTTEIIVKKSRFISNIKPISNETEAIAFINEMRSKYWEATHNVYAYIIGDQNIQRYSDDGEPSGTAGMPVLEVIKKEDLQDVVVVVTRYFGGTLLGAGGLVRAYAKSAKEALLAAGIVTNIFCDIIQIRIDYSLLGKIQNEIANSKCDIERIDYEVDVTVAVSVPVDCTHGFTKRIENLTNGRATITKIGNKYVSFKKNS